MIVTTTDENHDPRGCAPSLKNVWANRVLELDKQNYNFLKIYISTKSQLSDFYARRFLSERTNTENTQRIAQDNIDLSE
ncbi:TPA: hypothetical protein ACP2P2_004745, partial [Escherichia coli]